MEIAIALFLIASVFVFVRMYTVSTQQNGAPTVTENMKAVLATSKGFQHLVSYADNGFEPGTLTIQRGETVRFANNSSAELRVQALPWDGKIYPRGAENPCHQSALDSCTMLQPMEFWEFTFDATGVWAYSNNGNAQLRGVITVKE